MNNQTDEPRAVRSNVLLGSPTEYMPEMWTIRKDAIYAAIESLESGLEYAKSELAAHDSSIGRTILRNKRYAESVEWDIKKMEATLDMLKSLPNAQGELRREDGK